MLIEAPVSGTRPLRHLTHDADLAVIGGGLSGVCASIAAARRGLRVTLVQDRPVLGGNGSSEIRLWSLGATSHMGNNNRWAREGGLVDEIFVENLHRNREGNPHLFDTLLLEKVLAEPNITLLLDTALHDCAKSAPDRIASAEAFCPQTATRHTLNAPLFLDATGDGTLAWLAGAAARSGEEARSEFDEPLAPETPTRKTLGHSLFFYTTQAPHPVRYIPPAFALKDITRIPRWRDIRAGDQGCKLWWFEYGGDLDTIGDTDRIRLELLKVAHGAWNHIKNSGRFPEAANLTLAWIGAIPGKRESRRFEGDYTLSQHDLIRQHTHPDAVAYGGWAIDLHPSAGVYSPQPGCRQWHSKGVYQIPYRCLYSRNISNLFLAGRSISASHIAFGSTRVMATCGINAAAAGTAAALCVRHHKLPRDIARPPLIGELQRLLLRDGNHIPGVPLREDNDLARTAALAPSSTLRLHQLPPDGPRIPLDFPWAQMLPANAGQPPPRMTLTLHADKPVDLTARLLASAKPDNHTPDTTLASQTHHLNPGPNTLTLDFSDAKVPADTYLFYALPAAPGVTVQTSLARPPGLLSVCQKYNPAVAKSAVQTPPPGSGVDTFEYWCPQRRPGGHNLAFTLDPPLRAHEPANLSNGVNRPVNRPNSWAAAYDDKSPSLTLSWPTPQKITRLEIVFDTDFDHPMESVQWGHPESEMPQCVAAYRVTDASGAELLNIPENHQTLRVHDLAVTTTSLTLHLTPRAPDITPATLLAVRVY